MDEFYGYNQINILSSNQNKTTFIYPCSIFSYHKPPFGLKNVGETFQLAMNYAFHDIKNIIQPYPDDLPAHSKHFQDHPIHLRAILLRCQHYKI